MTLPDTLLPGLDFKSPAQVSAVSWLQIYKSCCEKDMPSLVILQLCFGREESSSLMLVCLQHKPSTPDLLFFKKLFIYFWLYWVFFAVWTFSSGGARASRCGGFSCCGAQALELASFCSCSVWAQQLCFLGSRAQDQ